ncbi:MAG TPA: serine/threonine-protein kinase [Myxococcota bacterium]|nr:serine/threonine-protein kinase [Myxococcota bacterium]
MVPFGSYSLLKQLSEDGLTERLLGRSVSIDGLGRDVVIERLPKEVCADPELISAFIAEASQAIAVNHANIAELYDFGEVEGVYYLAREAVHGTTLAQILALPTVAGRGLPPALALTLMHEALEGLDRAHHTRAKASEPAVLHGAMGPMNILVSADGVIKVAGLGTRALLLRRIGAAPAALADRLAYLAPEQLAGHTTAQSDVYACGIVLWELLTGRRPFTGAPEELRRRVGEGRIEPPTRHNPAVPLELSDLVMGALARDPTSRIASIRDLSRLVFNYNLRHHGEASLYLVQEFVETHGAALLPSLDPVAPEARPTPAHDTANPSIEAALTELAVSQFHAPNGLNDAVDGFRRNPRLWQLVEMGDIYRDSGQDEAALAAYRVAAVKFAQRALLAHSLLCCKRMLELRSMSELEPLIQALPAVQRLDEAALQSLLFPQQGPVEHLLQEMLAECAPAHGLVGAGTPLLSYLDGQAFADLALQAPLRVFADGARVIDEGDAGTTMYLLGKGRVVVYARTAQGEPVYLSSLTVGDFFGENSFFTGSPRSATVEALGDVEAFEIDQELYHRVMGDNAQAQQALLDFYRERIVNAVLAKSAIFGLLPSEERQMLVYKFNARLFEAGATLIREGDTSNTLYIIKSGQAEVFTTKGGPRVSLSYVGPGALVGEVAAVRKIPRTASVVATTQIEAFELDAEHFLAVLRVRPELHQRVNDTLAKRVRDNIDKVLGGSPWLRRG